MRTMTRAALGFLLTTTAAAMAGGVSTAAAGPGAPTVVAAPDDLQRLVPEETATVSVLDNDTVDGDPATPDSATVTPGEAPDPGLTLASDGIVSVGPTVQPGRYSYPYTVCATADPDACDSSAAALTVGAVVTFDPSHSVTGAPGGTTPSVLGGVILNGLPASAATVTARPGETPHTGLRMRIDGTITIEESTPPGTYTYPFLACANAEPFGCPSGAATVTVTGTAPVPDPGEDDGELPRTGTGLRLPVGMAGVLLAVGALLLVGRDRHVARLQPAPRHRLR